MNSTTQILIDGTEHRRIIPLSLSAKIAAKAAAKEAERLESQRNRPIRKVIHKPTYCYVTMCKADGSNYEQKRHALSTFNVRNDVQSKLSKSKMSQALNWMLLFSEKKRIYEKSTKKSFTFRLAFNTLTIPFPQRHPDDYIKEHMLQPYLYWLRRYYNASYVWKAETQTNGSIHFHITIDTFVHWRSVCAKWNKILFKYGYAKRFINQSALKKDAATQIKAIKNEKTLAACIGGYLTKDSIEEKEHNLSKKKLQAKIQKAIEELSGVSQNIETRFHHTRFVEGRIWGCSESLSKINCFTNELDPAFQDSEHNFFHDNQLKSLGKKMLLDAEQKYCAMDATTRAVMHRTYEDLEHQFAPYMNVYIHRHLKFTKLPPLLQNKLAAEKLSRNFHNQKFFTIESLN